MKRQWPGSASLKRPKCEPELSRNRLRFEGDTGCAQRSHQVRLRRGTKFLERLRPPLEASIQRAQVLGLFNGFRNSDLAALLGSHPASH
jgi:hypothetical protein